MAVRPVSNSSWGCAFSHGYANPNLPASKAGVRASGKGTTGRNAYVAGQRCAKIDLANGG